MEWTKDTYRVSDDKSELEGLLKPEAYEAQQDD